MMQPSGRAPVPISGLTPLHDLLKKSKHLVRGVVLHAEQGRPLDTDIVALPWGWMVALQESFCCCN